MGDSLYTSMAGLQAINARMEATASNLANAQTPGYAAVQAVEEAATYQGANAPTGADVVALTPGPDPDPRQPQPYGRSDECRPWRRCLAERADE